MHAADAAGCAIVDGASRVLLVHQTYGDRLWEVPGGVVAPGEPAWEAAIRECREELGITPQLPQLSGLYHRRRNGSYVFIFRAVDFAGRPQPDGVEIDDFGYFALDELPWPVTSFALQRLRDAVYFRGSVSLREEHEEDRLLVGRRSSGEA